MSKVHNFSNPNYQVLASTNYQEDVWVIEKPNSPGWYWGKVICKDSLGQLMKKFQGWTNDVQFIDIYDLTDDLDSPEIMKQTAEPLRLGGVWKQYTRFSLEMLGTLNNTPATVNLKTERKGWALVKDGKCWGCVYAKDGTTGEQMGWTDKPVHIKLDEVSKEKPPTKTWFTYSGSPYEAEMQEGEWVYVVFSQTVIG